MLHLFGCWLLRPSLVSQKASHSSVSYPSELSCYIPPLLQRPVHKESLPGADGCVSWDVHHCHLLGSSMLRFGHRSLSTFLWSYADLGWGLFACEWETPAKCTSELYLVHWVIAPLFEIRGLGTPCVQLGILKHSWSVCLTLCTCVHIHLLQHASSRSVVSTMLEVTGLLILNHFLRLLWGAVFKVFQCHRQLLGLLSLEIGIIEEEAFGEVWVQSKWKSKWRGTRRWRQNVVKRSFDVEVHHWKSCTVFYDDFWLFLKTDKISYLICHAQKSCQMILSKDCLIYPCQMNGLL